MENTFMNIILILEKYFLSVILMLMVACLFIAFVLKTFEEYMEFKKTKKFKINRSKQLKMRFVQ